MQSKLGPQTPLKAQTCSLHFSEDRFLSPHCSYLRYDRQASLLSPWARRRGFLARPFTKRSGLRGAWLCKESQLPLSTFCRLKILFPVSTSHLNVEAKAEAPGLLAALSFLLSLSHLLRGSCGIKSGDYHPGFSFCVLAPGGHLFPAR